MSTTVTPTRTERNSELVLIVEVSNTDARSAADLAALADLLRTAASDLLPGSLVRVELEGLRSLT